MRIVDFNQREEHMTEKIKKVKLKSRLLRNKHLISGQGQ
jgi:hypothetical protein